MKVPKPQLAPRTPQQQSDTFYGGLWLGVGALNLTAFILHMLSGAGELLIILSAITVPLNIGLSVVYFRRGRRKPLQPSTQDSTV